MVGREYGADTVILDMQNGRRFPLDQLGAVTLRQYCWSPNERRLLVVGQDSSWLIDAKTGHELMSLWNAQAITFAAFSSNQKLFTVDGGGFRTWDGSSLADDPPRYASVLADLAWDFVIDPHADTLQRLRAIELAQEACDRSVGVAEAQLTLGAAHYRAGNYRVALDHFASLTGQATPFPGMVRNPLMRRLLQQSDRFRFFLAMAQWKLGDTESANRTFAVAQVTGIEDESILSLAAEAAQLLGTTLAEKPEQENNNNNNSQLAGGGLSFRSNVQAAAASLISSRDQNNDGKVSEAEISRIWRAFCSFDHDGDGKLDEAELVEGLQANRRTNLSPEQWLSRYDRNRDGKVTQQEAPFVWNRYSRFDKNDDGALQRDEIAQAPPDAGPVFGFGRDNNDLFVNALLFRHDQNEDEKLNENEVSSTIWIQLRAYDSSGDQAIDRDELSEAIRQSPDEPSTLRQFLLLETIFSAQDSNDDQALTADEARPGFWDRFKELDADGDGRLELEELRRGLGHETEVMQNKAGIQEK